MIFKGYLGNNSSDIMHYYKIRRMTEKIKQENANENVARIRLPYSIFPLFLMGRLGLGLLGRPFGLIWVCFVGNYLSTMLFPTIFPRDGLV